MANNSAAPRAQLRTLLLVGGGAFLVFLAAQLPARLAWYWVGSEIPGLVLEGVEGSVWRGRAEQAFFGDHPLGEAKWTWRPLGLFAGELGARVTLETRDASAEGRLGRTLMAVTASQVAVRMPLAQLIREYGIWIGLTMTAEGMVRADIDRVALSDGRVDQLDGLLEVTSLTLDSTLIGDVSATVRMRDGELTMDLHSLDGSPVRLEGAVALSPEGGYKLDLLVDDPTTLGKDLEGLYRSFSTRTEAGQWRLKWQGSL